MDNQQAQAYFNSFLNMDENWLCSFNEYVLARLHEERLSNHTIANALAVSESTLHRRIVHLTSLSPLKYIRHLRLERAAELLLSGRYTTIKSVANEVGYQNVHYFSVHYEDYFGERPYDILKRL